MVNSDDQIHLDPLENDQRDDNVPLMKNAVGGHPGQEAHTQVNRMSSVNSSGADECIVNQSLLDKDDMATNKSSKVETSRQSMHGENALELYQQQRYQEALSIWENSIRSIYYVIEKYRQESLKNMEEQQNKNTKTRPTNKILLPKHFVTEYCKEALELYDYMLDDEKLAEYKDMVVRYHLNAAMACIKLLRWDDSCRHCCQALIIKINSEKGLYRLALSLFRSAQFAKAIEILDLAKNIRQDKLDLWNNMMTSIMSSFDKYKDKQKRLYMKIFQETRENLNKSESLLSRIYTILISIWALISKYLFLYFQLFWTMLCAIFPSGMAKSAEKDE